MCLLLLLSIDSFLLDNSEVNLSPVQVCHYYELSKSGIHEDLLYPGLWNGVRTLSVIKTAAWVQFKDAPQP